MFSIPSDLVPSDSHDAGGSALEHLQGYSHCPRTGTRLATRRWWNCDPPASTAHDTTASALVPSPKGIPPTRIWGAPPVLPCLVHRPEGVVPCVARLLEEGDPLASSEHRNSGEHPGLEHLFLPWCAPTIHHDERLAP